MLAGDGQNAQWQALAASGIYSREGKREAAVSFLERVYSVTDNVEIKADIEKKLAGLLQEGSLERAKRRSEAFNEMWRHDFPFLSRDGVLVIGPRVDVTLCSGGHGPAAACAGNWPDWFAAQAAR